MPIRIIVNGASGRMGQVTVKALAADPHFKLVGTAGRKDDLAKLIKATKAQVVIDFTEPSAVYANTLKIIKTGARPVIGTTGLKLAQIKKLSEQCHKLKRGAVLAPNFSLGTCLLLKAAQEFARYYPDVEIIEMHHDRKKDCPSGTALYTAEQLAAVRRPSKTKALTPHEIIPGSRGAHYQGIPIHALRLPGLVAHQQIIFGDLGETMTLKHDSIDRQCYMRGVLLACQKVMKLKTLVYGLDKIL